ncbi:hypothetical protein A2Z00_05515 [Candidatus Gottesmanbacteria bacterium RBG_13_45_10]|uniref:GIY-YIG domain-containing protein n=1 Tax=Candidatus Gottesmanbacteria bacterium RBG_13_45_10 TaxID=1798370 RepID=A0A1F5ZFL4_9BACT|nr:MAG: hypothetical protein A2Z00_05515 [Candidatus Gottesmanbacteria bacterium RBG_13_45_10]
MYYVYVLRSKKNNDLYIGSCRDLRVRFKQHNSGEVQSTKGYRPWDLIYYEAYRNKKDAGIREKRLKMHAVKNELKERIKFSIKRA